MKLPWDIRHLDVALGPAPVPVKQAVTPQELCVPVLETARHIPIEEVGMCDCDFSPFCDDTTTTRDPTFAKIRAREAGTSLAEDILGGG